MGVGSGAGAGTGAGAGSGAGAGAAVGAGVGSGAGAGVDSGATGGEVSDIFDDFTQPLPTVTIDSVYSMLIPPLVVLALPASEENSIFLIVPKNFNLSSG